MAVTTINFAGETTGTLLPTPSGWSALPDTMTWDIAEDLSASGERIISSADGTPSDDSTALVNDAFASIGDCEVLARIKAGGSGGTNRGGSGVLLRFSGSGPYNGYSFNFRRTSGSYDTFRIGRLDDVSGSLGAGSGELGTLLANATFLHDPNEWYFIRARVVGADLKVKVWLDGDAEPGSWLIEATDATYSTGRVGFISTQTRFYRGTYDYVAIDDLAGGGPASSPRLPIGRVWPGQSLGAGGLPIGRVGRPA